MPECVFCIHPDVHSSQGIPEDKFIKEYSNWWLFLQRVDKLKSTKQAAGLLISKEHLSNVTDVNEGAKSELLLVVKDAAKLLCAKVGSTYTGQESVGFNQGAEAGQTVMHAHVHLLPVSEEDPPQLKVRSGIGGAFEALRRERVSS
jgi:diadenosine tetraphosphate (Ap4A) HIT family hydrolase